MVKKRLCEYPGCGNKHHSNGWCQKHDARVRRTGSPDDSRRRDEYRQRVAALRIDLKLRDGRGAFIRAAKKVAIRPDTIYLFLGGHMTSWPMLRKLEAYVRELE